MCLYVSNILSDLSMCVVDVTPIIETYDKMLYTVLKKKSIQRNSNIPMRVITYIGFIICAYTGFKRVVNNVCK